MADSVNHPAHYESNGPFECIELAEYYDFCIGNAIKYVWRHMDKNNPVEDLNKALWYLQREMDGLGEDFFPAPMGAIPLTNTTGTHTVYYPAPMGAKRKLFTLSDLDFARMADFWYALFEGSLVDAKQAIQTRIRQLSETEDTK